MNPLDPKKPLYRISGRGIPWWAYGAIAVLLLILLAVPLYLTSRADFYGGYPALKVRYRSWRTSTHKMLSCTACHVKPGMGSKIVYSVKAIGGFYLGLLTRPDDPLLLNGPFPKNCKVCHISTRVTVVPLNVRVPHLAHGEVAGEKRNCLDCHKWLVHKENYQAKHKTLPLTAVCFKYGCHAGERVANDCNSCHHRESMPADQWRGKHREIVSARGANRCFDYCHEVSYCRQCHITGEKAPMAGIKAVGAQPVYLISQHAGPNWIRIHGEVALTDTTRCLYCHVSIQSCQECHKKRPAFHGRKATWLRAHKERAGVDSGRCLVCHEQGVCDKCHKLFELKRL